MKHDVALCDACGQEFPDEEVSECVQCGLPACDDCRCIERCCRLEDGDAVQIVVPKRRKARKASKVSELQRVLSRLDEYVKRMPDDEARNERDAAKLLREMAADLHSLPHYGSCPKNYYPHDQRACSCGVGFLREKWGVT